MQRAAAVIALILSVPPAQGQPADLRVLNEHGRPAAGAAVRIAPAAVRRACPSPAVGSGLNLWPTGQHERTSANASGVSLEPSAPGRFRLPVGREPLLALVIAPGHAPRVVAIDAGDRIVLARGSDVHLEVVDAAAAPVELSRIALVPLSVCTAALEWSRSTLTYTASTDRLGQADLRNVGAGSYAVTVVSEAGSFTAGPMVVDADELAFRLRLPERVAAHGRLVIESDTTATRGELIAVWDSGRELTAWTRTDFDPADPEWSVALPPNKQAYFFARLGEGCQFVGAGRAGETGELDNPLVVERPGIWHGRIIGEITADALTATALKYRGCPWDDLPAAVSTPVAADGSFELRGLRPRTTAIGLTAGPGRGVELKLDNDSGSDLGEVELRSGYTLAGQVVAEAGLPLLGVHVVAVPASGPACETAVDAEGRFACFVRSPPELPVTYYARGRLGSVRLAPDEGRPDRLRPASGTVLDLHFVTAGTAEGVRHVGLQLFDRAGGPRLRPKRNVLYVQAPEGRTRLELPDPGPFELSARHPDTGGAGEAVRSEPSGGVLILQLPPRAALVGDVVEGGSELPVQNAEVEVRPERAGGSGTVLSRVVQSDADGGWRLDSVGEGAYTLIASASGLPTVQKSVGLFAAGASAFHRLVLAAPGAIQGRVTGLELPSGVQVLLLSRTSSRGSFRRSSGLDPEGRFRFDDLPPGGYVVSVYGADKRAKWWGQRAEDVEVLAGRAAEVEIDLRQGVHLSGRVFLGGEPVPGASLIFEAVNDDRGRNSTLLNTDQDAYYKAVLPRPGVYEVRLESHRPRWSTRLELEVEDENRQEEDLRFSKSELHGRLVDGEGRPVTRAGLLLFETRERRPTDPSMQPEGLRMVNRWTSGSDGRFAFEALAPGDYVLEYEAQGFVQRPIGPVTLERDAVVDLGDVALERERRLRLRAEGPTGAPLARATIGAFPHGDFDRAMPPHAESGDDGRATLGGLGAGQYSLVGFYPGLAPAIVEPVNVSDGENAELVVRFGRGGALEVSVTAADGTPRTGVRVLLRDALGRDVTRLYEGLAAASDGPLLTDAMGRLTYPALRPGTYHVRVMGQGSTEQLATVVAGTRVGIDLTE